MSNSKRLDWLGPVRLGSFKACAKALGRALDVSHCRSLDALAKSCGWLSYQELNSHPDPRHGAGVPVVGSAEEIYDLWCKQVVISYGLQGRAELDAIERLPQLFRYVLACDPSTLADAARQDQDEEDVPRNVHDPMLRAGDWRDAEFRQWIRGIVDQSKPKRRNCDDFCEDAELNEHARLEEELG